MEAMIPSTTSMSTEQIASMSDRDRLLNAKEIMLSKGWCIHKVDYLAQTYDLTTFTYLAQQDRNLTRTANHDQCRSKPSCIAYNVNAETYKTRHVRDDCTCSMISVDMSKLVEIIQKGYVPLITISDDADQVDTPKLKLSTRGMFTKYFAMSHVWADGLGNPHGNALPTCQLRQIKQGMDNVSKGLWYAQGQFYLNRWFRSRKTPRFWMDTLCIPVGEEYEGLRNQSINDMASIYLGAQAVFVMDAGLMALSGAVDYLTSVVSSVWMDRSWTLQEGILSATCVFQFVDGLVFAARKGDKSRFTFHSSELGTREVFKETAQEKKRKRKKEMTDTNGVENQREALKQLYSKLEQNFFQLRIRPRSWWQKSLPGEVLRKGFTASWNALAGRSTTQSKDICTILANVLDFALEPLREFEEPEEKFQAIILSLREFPFSLFFNDGNRADQNKDHNNRWLPTGISKAVLTSSVPVMIGVNDLLVSGNALRDSALQIHKVETSIPVSIKAFSIKSRPTADAWIIEPYCNDQDEFDTIHYNATFIFIEKEPPHDGMHTRGAIFYSGTGNELVYYCPTRVRKIRSDRRPPQSDIEVLERVFDTSPITEPTDIRIRYDPLPDFKVLRTRSIEPATLYLASVTSWVWATILLVGICLCIVVEVVLGALIAEHIGGDDEDEEHSLQYCEWVIISISAFLLFLFGVIIVPALFYERYSRWKYVRSYENKSSERRKRKIEWTRSRHLDNQVSEK